MIIPHNFTPIKKTRPCVDGFLSEDELGDLSLADMEPEPETYHFLSFYHGRATHRKQETVTEECRG